MTDPRTELLAFSKKVQEMRDAQVKYYKAKAAKLDAYGALIEAKKIEKEVDDLVKLIKADHDDILQSNLFEPVHVSSIVRKGLTDPNLLAERYGQDVTVSWLNTKSDAWIKQTGKCNAVTIRMAELERIKDLEIIEKEATHG